MWRPLHVLLLLLLLGGSWQALPASNSNNVISEAITTKMKANFWRKNRLWERMVEEGKFEEMWDVNYLPDSICYPPGEEPCGRDRLLQIMKYLRENVGIYRIKQFDNKVFIQSDTAAVETCRWRGYHRNGTVLTTGNSMVMWEKHNGDWFWKLDMWNY